MEKEIFVKDLHDKTGCMWQDCYDAYDYMIEHNGNRDMAIAYLKAKSFAVYYRGPFDEKVQHFLKKSE